jgi:4-hydroxybenzoate polyprenyltransferase
VSEPVVAYGAPRSPDGSRLPAAIQLLRPQQWTKNLVAFAGVIFGGRITQLDAILLDLVVVIAFTAASAATYVFNDLRDVELDRLHPDKRRRPLASGRVSTAFARRLGALLLIGALGVAVFLNTKTLACIVAYLVINLLYSVSLKHVPLLDVTCIAVGYVLRVLAGVYVLNDMPTAWIVLCTFFLALFLGIAKRRSEFVRLESVDRAQRPVLRGYSLDLLDSLLNSSATMAVMCYALFTATSGKNPSLIVTVPIVYYAIMHYKLLVLRRNRGEEPEQILLKDVTIQISIVLWLICFVAIFYGHVTLFK